MHYGISQPPSHVLYLTDSFLSPEPIRVCGEGCVVSVAVVLGVALCVTVVLSVSLWRKK